MRAKKPRRVVFMRTMPVLLIQRARSFAQIAKAIVVFDAVDMVDLNSGPAAVRHDPSESMRKVVLAFDRDVAVSDGVDAAGLAGRNHSVHATKPHKNACLGIVRKQLVQSFDAYNFTSHDALPRRVVRGPAALARCCGSA